jgi:hypothetical protein
MRYLTAFLSLLVLAACASGGTPDGDRGLPAPDPKPSTPLPSANDRIRVVFPRTATQPERIVTGRLVRLVPDTVVIAAGINVEAVPLAGRQLQVVVGSHGRALRGLGVGVLAGGAFGGALGALSYQPCHSTEFMGCLMAPSSAGEAAAVGAVGGALVGGLLGLTIGALSPQDVWGTVMVPEVRSGRDATVIGLRISF